MPDSLHPPYNIVQPRVLQRWLDINSQNGALRRTRGYFELPTFSINVTWLGYSDIVGVFNFTAANNFSIKNYRSITNNGSYTLAIAFLDSDDENSMTRYLLISDPDDVIYDTTIPVYSGQIIKKNFRLEIWSTPTTPASQSSVIRLSSSVLGNTDYRYGDDFSVGTASVLCTQQANINSVLPTQPPQSNLNFWFTWDFGITLGTPPAVSSWADHLGNLTLTQGTAGLRPALGSSYIQFLGDDALTAGYATQTVFLMLLVDRNVAGINAQPILQYSSNSFTLFGGDGIGNNKIVTQYSGIFSDFTLSTIGGSTHVIILNTPAATTSAWDALFDVFVGSGTSVGGEFTNNPGSLTLGNGSAGVVGFNLRAILGYSQVLSAQDQAEALLYLFNSSTISPDITLPLNFAACTTPTVN